MSYLVTTGPRLFRESTSILGESLWFGADGELKWCDITAGILYSSSLSDEGNVAIGEEPPVAGFQPTRSGGYVVAGKDTVYLLDADGNGRQEIAQVEHRHDGIRFNEVRCDPHGRLIVGSMDVTTGDLDCAIYSIDPDGRTRILIGGIGVANGFEWSDDGRQMYFADTAVSTLYVGDYSDDGELSTVRPFVSRENIDGTARDVDGGIWAGLNDSASVVRFAPDGSRDLAFDIPAGHVTSVAFGGSDFSTLFIATSRENLTERELEDRPLSGSIFALETATRGYPPRAFGRATEEGKVRGAGN